MEFVVPDLRLHHHSPPSVDRHFLPNFCRHLRPLCRMVGCFPAHRLRSSVPAGEFPDEEGGAWRFLVRHVFFFVTCFLVGFGGLHNLKLKSLYIYIIKMSLPYIYNYVINMYILCEKPNTKHAILIHFGMFYRTRLW